VARIVRPMKKDPADPQQPLVAPRFCCLGIRPHEIDLDQAGCVVANRKGMSVSADWRGLRPELIPEELDDGAMGRGERIWRRSCWVRAPVYLLKGRSRQV